MSSENKALMICALSEVEFDIGIIDPAEDPDIRHIEHADISVTDVGDGNKSVFFDGDEDSFVYSRDLFNADGTLVEQCEALYVKGNVLGRDGIVRIERDGSWIKAEPLNPYSSKSDRILERGRLDEWDVSFVPGKTTVSDGREKVIFGVGIGPLTYIESITAILREKEKIPSSPRIFVYENDVTRRFDQYVSDSTFDSAK